MVAIITVIVGIVGLIVGWLVSGYQNITEKLTEERRSAYLGGLFRRPPRYAKFTSVAECRRIRMTCS